MDSTSQMHNFWQQAVETHMERMRALYTQMGKLEADNVKRAAEAFDEMARLGRLSLEQSMQLSTEWRKLGLEAVEKTLAASKKS